MVLTNYFLWLEMVGTLATVVAHAEGKAKPNDLAYLSMLTTGMREGTLTDTKLMELNARIKAEKLAGYEPTNDELKDVEERLLERSERIQGTQEPT